MTRMIRDIFQLDHQAQLHGAQLVEKVMITREPGKKKKLQTDVFLPTAVQASLHHDFKQTLTHAGPIPMPRPGRIQQTIPKDVQTHCQDKQRVGN